MKATLPPNYFNVRIETCVCMFMADHMTGNRKNIGAKVLAITYREISLVTQAKLLLKLAQFSLTVIF